MAQLVESDSTTPSMWNDISGPLSPSSSSNAVVARGYEQISSSSSSSSSPCSSESGSRSISYLKRLLQRNQGIVMSIQYITRGSIMFIPSSFRFYEVAAEGCYSISNIINTCNDVILNDNVERCKGLEDYMILATRGVTQIEVLAEKIALTIGGEYRRSQIVFYLELLKCTCRLLMLVDRGSPTLLIHWNTYNEDPNEHKMNLLDYEMWYTRPTINYTAASTTASATASASTTAPASATVGIMASTLTLPIDMSLHIEASSSPSSHLSSSVPVPVPVHVRDVVRNANGFIGSRSGLKLQLDSQQIELLQRCGGSSNFEKHEEEPIQEQVQVQIQIPTATSIDIDEDENGNSNHNNVLDDNANANSWGNTLNISSSPSTDNANANGSENATSAPGEFGSYGPEFYIVLGEVLYILRPAVYAWALHQVSKCYDEENDDGDGVDTSSSSTSGSSDNAAEDPSSMLYIPDEIGRRPRHHQRGGTTIGQFYRRARAAIWPSNIGNTISSVMNVVNTVTQRPTPAGSNFSYGTCHILAAAVAMVVEVMSIKLTLIGLSMARDKADAVNNANINNGIAFDPSHNHNHNHNHFLNGNNNPPFQRRYPTRTRPHPFDNEIQRRKMALLFYLLRTPLFNRATLPLLQYASTMLERIPLIGSLPATAIQLLRYLNRTHFYTSASS